MARRICQAAKTADRSQPVSCPWKRSYISDVIHNSVRLLQPEIAVFPPQFPSRNGPSPAGFKTKFSFPLNSSYNWVFFHKFIYSALPFPDPTSSRRTATGMRHRAP